MLEPAADPPDPRASLQIVAQRSQATAAAEAAAGECEQSQEAAVGAAAVNGEDRSSSGEEGEQPARKKRRQAFDWAPVEPILQQFCEERSGGLLRGSGGAPAALGRLRDLVAAANEQRQQQGKSQLSVKDLDVAAFKRKYQQAAKEFRARSATGAGGTSVLACGGSGSAASLQQQQPHEQQQQQQQQQQSSAMAVSASQSGTRGVERGPAPSAVNAATEPPGVEVGLWLKERLKAEKAACASLKNTAGKVWNANKATQIFWVAQLSDGRMIGDSR